MFIECRFETHIKAFTFSIQLVLWCLLCIFSVLFQQQASSIINTLLLFVFLYIPTRNMAMIFDICIYLYK